MLWATFGRGAPVVLGAEGVLALADVREEPERLQGRQTHSHRHTDTLTPTLILTLTPTLILTLAPTLTLTHTLAHTLTLTHTHTHWGRKAYFRLRTCERSRSAWRENCIELMTSDRKLPERARNERSPGSKEGSK